MTSFTCATPPAHLYNFKLKQLCAGLAKYTALICCLFVAHPSTSQNITDTIGTAIKFKNSGNIKQAAALLQAYNKSHKTDLNSAWLYAQTVYWLKDFKKTEKIYEQTIASHPGNFYLKLDYANTLLAIGDIKKAKTILYQYRTFDSTSAGFKTDIAILYWQDKNKKPEEALYKNYAPSSADTLNKVKQLKGNGSIKQSFALLKSYYKNHSTDFNATWLYAQTAYLNSRFKLSKTLYQKAAEAQPSNYYLKLDYASTLVNIADLKQAKPLLATYRSYDSTNTKLLVDLAKINFAEGNYNGAQKEANTVLTKDPGNTDALAILDQLNFAKASWVKVKANYNIDSQPLQTITPAVEAGIYLHPAATLKLNLQTPVFISNGILKNAQWFQVGDQSAFHKSGFQLSFDAGIVKQPFENKISWTANIELKQLLLKHLVLQAEAERKPYYYTVSSLDTLVMVNRFSAYAEWNDLNSWNGRIAFEFNQFNDKNYTLGGNAWVFTPPLKVSVFEARIGYAYSFNTSKNNRFVPEKTLAQILNPYDATAAITGLYDPYFTPNNMQIHSALISITIHPVKIFDIGFNANVGFYANTLNPYFYLNNDASNNTYIAKDYSKEKFTPLELSAYALVRITKKISLKADYTYRKTYFYTSNSAGLGLKINFWNEQKGK